MRKAEADIVMLRAALAGLVGADSEQDLRVRWRQPCACCQRRMLTKVVSINAIHALLATMTPNAAGKALANRAGRRLTVLVRRCLRSERIGR